MTLQPCENPSNCASLQFIDKQEYTKFGKITQVTTYKILDKHTPFLIENTGYFVQTNNLPKPIWSIR